MCLPHESLWDGQGSLYINEVVLSLGDFPPDILGIAFLSWLSRSESQDDKEHRIAVRGFVSLKGRKSDLPPLGV